LYQSPALVSPFGRWTKELIDGREHEVGTVIGDWHDDALLGGLQQALRAGRAVPPDFVAAARCAFAWRDIDVELARLSYDSPGELNQAGRPPAETASLHTLSFRSGLLSIVLEVGRDCLIGQILPAQPALLRVQASTGPAPVIRFDEHGCFIIEPIPCGRFRLHCMTAASTVVLTRWISL
jgi:hypothetical protein